MASCAQAAREPTLDLGLGTADHLRAEGLGELDRRLAVLCRERGPLRAILARVASRLVSVRAWERIGYARLSDYAIECLGLSARSVRSLAGVGSRLAELPRLQDALMAGTLGWTRVRLLACLPRGEDEVAWISYARRVTAQDLSRAVRAVDRGSVEAGAAEDPGARSRLFEVRCTPEVRWKWHVARRAAARAAGRVLHVSEAAELIAAEVLSALPIDEHAERGVCEEPGVSWSGESDAADAELRPPWRRHAPSPEDESLADAHPCGQADSASPAPLAPGPADPANPTRPTSDLQRPSLLSAPVPRLPLPASLKALLEGLEEADAFELDARFRRALQMEQRLDARIGPVLDLVWGRFVHRALGHATREAYARERLGMDPTRARSLVRLERAAAQSPPFARAYRSGAVSWVKAGVLAPLVVFDPLAWFVEGWLGWAQRVTVRRLGEDVERALALAEMNPEAFRQSGGLPPEALEHREVDAREKGSLDSPGCTEGEREIGARPMEAEEHLARVDSGASTPTSPGSAQDDRAPEGRALGDREIGATTRGTTEDSSAHAGTLAPPECEPEIWLNRKPWPLKSAPEEVCWARFFGPPDVVQLFQAVLCTVRRRMEQDNGRLPTSGEALGVMLDHVLSTWGVLDGKLAARHKVFARDGWRCAVPGCTSMQNLHDHHVRFRSAGGSDALDNRITLCAFHHLRGVHAGLLRCVGRAPGGLLWEMGIRPGVTPLLAYRSGDIRIRSIQTMPAPARAW